MAVKGFQPPLMQNCHDMITVVRHPCMKAFAALVLDLIIHRLVGDTLQGLDIGVTAARALCQAGLNKCGTH